MTSAPFESPEDRRAAVAELHEHLAATAERPVERTASRWLGEAEAIAADLLEATDDQEVVRERAEKVASLLEQVESTDDSAADEHVAAAARLADQLQAE